MEDTNSFRQYAVIKQQVADLIRAARQAFELNKTESWADECRVLQTRLAADRFNLVVLGQFKRGKSSLINAIIGRDLLPTGLLPLTSAITTLHYGPQERVSLIRQGWILDQEIPLTELPDFVTEQGNPGNEKGLIEARVELPVPFLRRGVFFIDTPGVGSIRAENTATTYSFLPEADAVIFVTSVEAALSQVEQDFLREIANDVRRLFVVVNKIDLVSAAEREKVIEYVRSNVETILGTGDFPLFAVSARDALAARSPGAKAASGIEGLEAALEEFLVSEKSRAFLVSVLDRLIQILTRALTEQGSESRLPAMLQPVKSVATRLRDALLIAEQSISDMLHEIDLGAVTVRRAMAERTQAAQPAAKKALPRTRTCPICAQMRQELFDYFVDLQQMGAPEQLDFQKNGGLCQVHAWQFRELAAPITINEMYALQVESIAARLRLAHDEPENLGTPASPGLLVSGHCPACTLQEKAEKVHVARFLGHMESPEGQVYYRDALGPCLHHLQKVLNAGPSKEIRDFILAEQAARLEELSEDMRNYVLKRDALRRDLLNTNEANAWTRALIQVVGERLSYSRSTR
jgi:ribosome biogenesis GTPase A